MQCLKLKENFIFCCPCELFIKDEANDFKKIRLLVTITSMYFFTTEHVTITSKENERDIKLEDLLYLKVNHIDMFLNDSTETEISYKVVKNASIFQMMIKLKSVYAKEYIRILLLIQGWFIDYYAQKKTNFSKPNYSCLFKILDTYITNNFTFIIDNTLYLYLKKKIITEDFAPFLTILQKIKFTLFLKQGWGSELGVLFSNPRVFMNLTYLSMSSINLTDDLLSTFGLSFIRYSPYLETLDLSNNVLTNKTLENFVANYPCGLRLKTLDLSYNNINNKKLHYYLTFLTKSFISLTLFDLRGNKFDNKFLEVFEPKNVEEIRMQLELLDMGTKENLVFDFRNTNIEIDKIASTFYLKKKDILNHIEIKNVFTENFENKYFSFDKIRFIFDIGFYKKTPNINGVSRNIKNINFDVKAFKFHKKKSFRIITKSMKQEIEEDEVDLDDKKSIKGNSNVNNSNLQVNTSMNKTHNSINNDNNVNVNTLGPNNPNATNANIVTNNNVTVNNANNKSDDTIKKTLNNIEEEQKDVANNNNNESNNQILKTNPNNNNNNNYDAEIIYDTDEEEEIDDKATNHQSQQSIAIKEAPKEPNILLSYYIDRIPELDLYRELFLFFFLLDYYFDPILNSFSSYESRYIPRLKDFMNESIQSEQYEKLKSYFTSKKNSIGNSYEEKAKKEKEKERKTYREIPLEEAAQMYYDYKNILCPYTISKNTKGNETVVRRNIEINDLINKIFEKIFKKRILNDNDRFSPNCFINELSYFFLYLQLSHDYKIKIPFTTLNKYISRVKIESAICIKEKAHNSLNYLSKISSRMKLSVQSSVTTAFNRVNQKAAMILEGLLLVLNYQGRSVDGNTKNKNFLFESNNFLDIFLNKAESIELVDDLVYLGKYVQYMRNNSLRNEIYSSLTDLYQKEASITKYNMNEEFSPANDEYKKFKDPIKLNIPKEIIHKELSLHPANLDYLSLSECSEKDFIDDLGEISRLISSNQSYGKRNLYDRLKFIFVSTSKKRKNEDYLYKLHKGNIYLKIMRVLFRYFNAIDFRDYHKRMSTDLSRSDIKQSSTNMLLNSSSFLGLRTMGSQQFGKLDESKVFTTGGIQPSMENIAIEERNLRINDVPENEEEKKLSKIELENKRKLNLLKYCESLNEPETLLDISQVKDISMAQLERFTKFTGVFFTKCQERLKNINSISQEYFCVVVQYYIRFYLEVKTQFSQDTKYWELQNLECFYQLFRFANRNDFEDIVEEEKKENNEEANVNKENIDNDKNKDNTTNVNQTTQEKKINYPFAFLYLMCWYFDFNETMIRRIKGFIYYLFAHLIQRKFCKGIIRALNNPYRYSWVMSTFEIIKKIRNEPLIIDVSYPSHENRIKESYEITETTTVGELVTKIRNESINLKECSERGLYWLYYVINDKPNNYQYLSNEELIVDLIGSSEENEREIETFSNENRSKGKGNKAIFELEKIEISNYGQNSMCSIYKPDKSFRNVHFEMRRRIFSPILLNGDISKFSYKEQEILFHQIKSVFYNSAIVDYTWYGIGEEIAIACYFETIAQSKRDDFLERSKLDARVVSMKDIESFDFPFSEKDKSNKNMSSYSLNKEDNKDNSSVTKYVSNDIVIDYPKSLGKTDNKTLSSLYNNVKRKISKLKHPKAIFFELIKNYPLLFANIFEVSVRQCNDSFPEKFLISVSLEKVQFLYRKNYRKFLEFKYDEIIKCLITDQTSLLLSVNIPKDDLDLDDERFELIARLESFDSRYIMEDILSYAQIYLATHTTSELVTFSNGILNLKDYHLIFHRNLPFRDYPPPRNVDNNKIDIEKMRENLHNTTRYQEYKENKLKKQKEEEDKKKANQKKGKLDITKLTNIPRYHNPDANSEEENSSDSEVKVKKINWTGFKNNSSSSNNISGVDKKDMSAKDKSVHFDKTQNEEELKKIKEEEEAKRKKEEEERKKKEEEEKIQKQKLDENMLKKQKANESLMKALQAFDFDDDEEEQQEGYDDY